MCSLSSSSMLFPSKLLYHKPVLIRPRNVRPLQFRPTSLSQQNLGMVSWSESNFNAPLNGYNGWEIVDFPKQDKEKSKGLPKIVIVGVGAAVASVLSIFGYFLLPKKGFELQISATLNALHEKLPHPGTHEQDKDGDVASDEVDKVCVPNMEIISDVVDEYVTKEANDCTTGKGEFGRLIIPFPVDSTQQEALFVLKKLKIIDDEVKAEEFCTRREYARWLVRTNSELERSTRQRLMPTIALSGSTFPAFDDVSIQDPDFQSIQTLAEAGIIPSKLSENLASNDQEVNFYPERIISRQDLICWKAKLEYEIMPGVDAEISRKNIGFLDARHISSDALVDLYADISADEKSIVKRVFGQSKRFQSSRPSTIAQAAVALTSGRIMEFINEELLRLEAETNARQVAIEEIKLELLERGDIKRCWETKIEDERSRISQKEMAYDAAMKELEKQKLDPEGATANTLKQKTALECQLQLLSSLKEEVNDMTDKLVTDRAAYISEQSELQQALSEQQVRLEELLDRKSVLEAEIEALRILRSWIEEEAQKSQSHAKVLEEAGRRWRWDNQSTGTNSTT
ncbi:hypothetical protein Leryth_012512 [Lithospermum erythrorhizon]|nr:hypothetical protein Leryth_012512 [Lithospermum erythrorhizon]